MTVFWSNAAERQKKKIKEADLRRANFVESDKGHSLDEPGEREITLAPKETKKAR
jgi:hypothetical protein